MSKLKSCANIVKCIGTISEILIEFIPKNDNILLKISCVLNVNNSYLKFNFFTNKKLKNDYYNLISLFGIPYDYIEQIDNDSYVMNEQLIGCEVSGKIRVWLDSNSKLDYILPSKSDRLFIVSNINKYGNNVTYAQRTKNKSGLEVKLQGAIFKINKKDSILTIVNTSTNGDVKFIDMRYDNSLLAKIQATKKCCICDLSIIWDKGYDLINDNIVSNTNGASYKVVDVKETTNCYEKESIKDILTLYKIEQELETNTSHI